MYIYNIGYNSYEESEDVQLYHEQKFSKKEFENIVIKATINVLKSRKIKKGEHVTFQRILHCVVKELIRNVGFKKVEFTAGFNVFGWANILDKKDWEDDRDEQLKLLTKDIIFEGKEI